MTNLAEFNRPPVVETVLGAQFARLPLTTAHAGWFWKKYLGSEWPAVVVVPRLEDRFERFDDAARAWNITTPLRLLNKAEPDRLQIVRSDEERMVQVQDSRFIYNWRKQKNEYPTYRQLRPEYEHLLERFQEFIREVDVGAVTYNQWEVVYVNHLPKGELWDSTADWIKIFPGFYAPHDAVESVQAIWSHVIAERAGRLFIEMRPAVANERDVIRVQITARGPTQDASAEALFAGFDLGHETIVNAFTAMTSEAAHMYWGRTR